jgi:hypothetical protein
VEASRWQLTGLLFAKPSCFMEGRGLGSRVCVRRCPGRILSVARSEGDASEDRTATRAGELVFLQRQVNKKPTPGR